MPASCAQLAQKDLWEQQERERQWKAMVEGEQIASLWLLRPDQVNSTDRLHPLHLVRINVNRSLSRKVGNRSTWAYHLQWAVIPLRLLPSRWKSSTDIRHERTDKVSTIRHSPTILSDLIHLRDPLLRWQSTRSPIELLVLL